MYMVFDWNEEKNQELKNKRDVCFEQIVIANSEDHLLDILEHPNKQKYKDQLILVVEINEYVYVVPVVHKSDRWFMKTIYPNRKLTDKYLPGKRRKGK